MEVSSPSSSSPLSVHSMDFSPHRHRFFKSLPNSIRNRHRICSSSSSSSYSYSSHNNNKFNASHHYQPLFLPLSYLSSSSSSSVFGLSISFRDRCHSLSPSNHRNTRCRRRRSFSSIFAVFERFTERAIKAVIFSQREAKSLGKDMVFTQHLLLGLVAEDRASDGFLGSGITIERAREAVRSIWSENTDHDPPQSDEAEARTSPTTSSSSDVPFSISTKRVFEAAVEYSRSMGYDFIAPEHISIGLFMVDDGSAGRVLKR